MTDHSSRRCVAGSAGSRQCVARGGSRAAATTWGAGGASGAVDRGEERRGSGTPRRPAVGPRCARWRWRRSGTGSTGCWRCWSRDFSLLVAGVRSHRSRACAAAYIGAVMRVTTAARGPVTLHTRPVGVLVTRIAPEGDAVVEMHAHPRRASVHVLRRTTLLTCSCFMRRRTALSGSWCATYLD